ncbi:class I SAM-dependent methyltransferase [Cognatishimia sp. SS12]|uniref:class I SAM-dependent methyltransferase n=1 Tax=Cognatishimia sp. SS12 TaxID=2979465 RepID=UPI00232DB61B|nr:class I SAM-dependent methyltransferase [Cognatishimia sp. SS12]MDC0738866.1 class I SAM-dependent methyltransferase [Cognatishimia sp. SS12]
MTLQEQYDQAAPRWATRLSALGFTPAYAALMAAAAPRHTGSLCDVGAGSGALSQAFYARFGAPKRHVLLDTSAAMLQTARAALPATTQIETEQALLADYRPQCGFDVTLAGHVIEHCPSPETALQQIAALTRPGGTVILAVSHPHICQIVIWLKWRHRWFRQDDVCAMAARAGLRLSRILRFETGVPARISRGYIFTKPTQPQETPC